MTVLECRSCGDRWEPLNDPERNQPGVKVELTFCRLCSKWEHDGVTPRDEDEGMRESEEED